MERRVTGFAQGYQITPIMRASLTQRNLVVHFLGLHDNSTLETQFTKGMLLHILITDTFPRTSISFLGSLVSSILLIITVHLALMLRAISAVSQIRTARISTGFLWSSRHLNLSKKEPPPIPIRTSNSSYHRYSRKDRYLNQIPALSSFAIITISQFFSLMVVPP